MSVQTTSSGSSDPTAAVRRIESARYLVKPKSLRESIALTPQPSARNSLLAGLQAAATAALALPLIQLSPWSGLIGYASLGTLAALFGRFAPLKQRGRILLWCVVLQTLMVFTMSALTWAGASTQMQILFLALACAFFFIVSNAGKFGPPGALIFIFAGSVAMAQVDSFQQVLERTVATGAAGLLACFVCRITDRWREPVTKEKFPPEPSRPISHQLIATARIVAGTAIAAYAAHFSGANYPGWAAMGALAVMQGAHLHITMSRALQRMAGTVAGSVLVYMVLIHEPSVWLVIPLLLLLTVATEVIIGTNYGVGQVLVTPMALLMGYIAAPGAAAALVVQERVLDTLIGITLGVFLSVVFSTLDDRVHLARWVNARGPDSGNN